MSNEPTPALAEQLRALSEKATQGEWTPHGWFFPGMVKGDLFAKDSERVDEATPICRFVAPVPKLESGKSPVCSLQAIVEKRSHQKAIEANATFVAALVNAFRAGHLTPTDRRGVEADGWNEAVEACAVRMAEYMAQEQPMNGSITEACAVLRALKRPLPAPPASGGE